MSKLSTLIEDISNLFPEYQFGINSPGSIYPCVNFNIISSINTRCNSFNSSCETFQVQFSIFDKESDCFDLIDEEALIETTLKESTSLSGNNFVEVKKLGVIGPRYLQNDEFFQIIATYNITVGEEK